jgi:CBS domain-containing protein
MKVKDCVMIEPFTCHENDSIVEVAKKLRHTTIRHIFVVNNSHTPIGVISVMDINNRVVAENKDASKTKAKDIMTKSILIANSEDEVEHLAKKMLEKNHVMDPVVKDNKMIGIITIHQLLKNSSR